MLERTALVAGQAVQGRNRRSCLPFPERPTQPAMRPVPDPLAVAPFSTPATLAGPRAELVAGSCLAMAAIRLESFRALFDLG